MKLKEWFSSKSSRGCWFCGKEENPCHAWLFLSAPSSFCGGFAMNFLWTKSGKSRRVDNVERKSRKCCVFWHAVENFCAFLLLKSQILTRSDTPLRALFHILERVVVHMWFSNIRRLNFHFYDCSPHVVHCALHSRTAVIWHCGKVCGNCGKTLFTDWRCPCASRKFQARTYCRFPYAF